MSKLGAKADEEKDISELVGEHDSHLLAIARYVSRNSPSWYIEQAQPARGLKEEQVTVVKVLGGYAIDRSPMTIKTGQNYSYRFVDGGVQGLTSASDNKLLYGNMAPDQYLDDTGLSLDEVSIKKIIVEIKNKYPRVDEAKLKTFLQTFKLHEVEHRSKDEKKHSGTMDSLYQQLNKNFQLQLSNADPNDKTNKAIRDVLLKKIGEEHIKQVAGKIAGGKQYAAISIAGDRGAEVQAFDFDGYDWSVESLQKTNETATGKPTATYYENGKDSIKRHLVLQSKGEMHGKKDKLAFHGDDLDLLFTFVDQNMREGVPIAVNCTDGIDRTGMVMLALMILDKSKELSNLSTEKQQSAIIDMLEKLREDRGPYFLRSKEDIGIGVTLGYALIAVQNQYKFQEELSKKNPAIAQIVEKSKENRWSVRGLRAEVVKIDKDKISDEDRKQWLTLIDERMKANNSYLIADHAGKYQTELYHFSEKDVLDGPEASTIPFYDSSAQMSPAIDKKRLEEKTGDFRMRLYRIFSSIVNDFITNPTPQKLTAMGRYQPGVDYDFESLKKELKSTIKSSINNPHFWSFSSMFAAARLVHGNDNESRKKMLDDTFNKLKAEFIKNPSDELLDHLVSFVQKGYSIEAKEVDSIYKKGLEQLKSEKTFGSFEGMLYLANVLKKKNDPIYSIAKAAIQVDEVGLPELKLIKRLAQEGKLDIKKDKVLKNKLIDMLQKKGQFKSEYVEPFLAVFGGDIKGLNLDKLKTHILGLEDLRELSSLVTMVKCGLDLSQEEINGVIKKVLSNLRDKTRTPSPFCIKLLTLSDNFNPTQVGTIVPVLLNDFFRNTKLAVENGAKVLKACGLDPDTGKFNKDLPDSIKTQALLALILIKEAKKEDINPILGSLPKNEREQIKAEMNNYNKRHAISDESAKISHRLDTALTSSPLLPSYGKELKREKEAPKPQETPSVGKKFK